MNVALVLGQPLLLTGEPGCGKTQLASNLAWSLDLTRCSSSRRSPTRRRSRCSTATTRSRHFEASSRGDGGRSGAVHHLERAREPRSSRRYRPRSGSGSSAETPTCDEPRRSVVLIDEIDKAPRDFPNDVLNELEHLYFRVPECGNVVLRADDRYRPIVVITSNSERDLPEPFLRRCVFHHIAFPDEDTVRRIALNHLGAHVRGLEPLLDEAVALFAELRADVAGLSRRPGLAEFLNWLIVLGELWSTEGRLTARTACAARSACWPRPRATSSGPTPSSSRGSPAEAADR